MNGQVYFSPVLENQGEKMRGNNRKAILPLVEEDWHWLLIPTDLWEMLYLSNNERVNCTINGNVLHIQAIYYAIKMANPPQRCSIFNHTLIWMQDIFKDARGAPHGSCLLHNAWLHASPLTCSSLPTAWQKEAGVQCQAPSLPASLKPLKFIGPDSYGYEELYPSCASCHTRSWTSGMAGCTIFGIQDFWGPSDSTAYLN